MKLKEFEGSIPWMYRDTVGKVTVGVGLMLPDAAAASALPFTFLGSSASATAIAEDYARVAAMVEGQAASCYRSSNSPCLPQTVIDTNLTAILESFDTRLRTALHGYEDFPGPVKLALLDMAYNLGPAALLGGYPRMLAAVEEGHWALAASECMRHGPGALRNAWTRDQFLVAVVGTIKAEALEAGTIKARAEKWLLRLWRRLCGFWA